MKLGFIAMTGALLLIAVVELLGDRLKKKPDFEEILQELDWRAVFFYIALFALVGGLEKVGILHDLAELLTPIFASSVALGTTLLYWVTIPIVGVVEHDAYILTFLYTIRDLAEQGIDPWPLWWMLVWSGTLGSNFTVPARRRSTWPSTSASGKRSGDFAAGVPGLERAVHPRSERDLLRVRDADLGAVGLAPFDWRPSIGALRLAPIDFAPLALRYACPELVEGLRTNAWLFRS